MAAAIGKFAANKLLKNQMKSYQSKKAEGGDDPYFAYVEDPRRPGKTKKVKKLIPDYIPEHDAMILASVRKTSYRLDMCLFNLLGIRFGWSSVIGIVPALGDVIDAVMAILIYRKCCSVEGGLDSSTRTKMLINIILDFGVGLVPFLGDLADAAFKCNTRNARQLEIFLDKKYRPDRLGNPLDDARDPAGRRRRQENRKSGIYHPQDPPPATVFEDFSDEEERTQFAQDQDRDDRVQRPQPARAPEDRSGGGGLFGGTSKKDRRQDGQPMRQQSRRQETGSVTR